MSSKIAVSSWSGGKDGCLAYYKAIQKGVEVKSLLNFVSKESKRGCFHGLESQILKLQAELIGVPLAQKEVTADMNKYEEEFKEAVNEFILQGVNSMVFGDIYLQEHQSWVDRVCHDLNIQPIEPLWQAPAEDVIDEFLDSGFTAIVVSAKADIMGKEFLGRSISRELARELKQKGVCPCGEKGEFHTLVVDGPIFSKRIEITEAIPVLKNGFWQHWFLDIRQYKQVDKN